MLWGGQAPRARAELYRLFAVRAPERLPPHLRARRADQALPIRCGTPVVRAVAARLSAMPADVRYEAEALLHPAPRTAARTLDPAGGAGKAAAPALRNWITTENFTVEWGPDLTNEDGTSPPRDDGPLWAGDPAVGGNGIPDVAERWAAYFETSYRKIVEEYGYTHPAVDANRIPVYIANSDPGTVLENLGGSTYALTQPGENVPYIVVNNDLSFVPPNGEGGSGLVKIQGAMKITAAHELFHVFHFLYEPDAWIPEEDDWWFEASATWMEDEVFDSVNDYVQYLAAGAWPAFVDQGLPVRSTDPHYTVRAYGAVIFAKYLSEHVGGRAAVFDVWQRIRGDGLRILPALDAFAASTGLQGLPGLFLGFAGAVAVMDFEEGASYGKVPASSGVDGLSFFGLGYLGVRYRSEDVVAGETTLSYQTPTDSGWGIVTAYKDPDTGQYVYGTAMAAGGRVTLSVKPTATVRLVVGAARLTPDPVPEPAATPSGGGGGGGGCFVQILLRRCVP